MKSKMIFAALLSMTAISVFAQSTPVVDQREAYQQARIQQGVSSGQLTPGETARLEHGQQHVQNVEARAKADGVVTPTERAHLAHAQDVQSRKIRRLKHNDVHN